MCQWHRRQVCLLHHSFHNRISTKKAKTITLRFLCWPSPFSRFRAAHPKLPTVKIFMKVSQNSYHFLASLLVQIFVSLFDRNKYVLQVFIVNCYRIPTKILHLENCVLLLYQKCYRIQHVCWKTSERCSSNVLR